MEDRFESPDTPLAQRCEALEATVRELTARVEALEHSETERQKAIEAVRLMREHDDGVSPQQFRQVLMNAYKTTSRHRFPTNRADQSQGDR